MITTCYNDSHLPVVVWWSLLWSRPNIVINMYAFWERNCTIIQCHKSTAFTRFTTVAPWHSTQPIAPHFETQWGLVNDIIPTLHVINNTIRCQYSCSSDAVIIHKSIRKCLAELMLIWLWEITLSTNRNSAKQLRLVQMKPVRKTRVFTN